MKRTYPLFQQYIASTLLISLCLQSCGDTGNLSIREEEPAEIIGQEQGKRKRIGLTGAFEQKLTVLETINQ
jgi:hypothetical protein